MVLHQRGFYLLPPRAIVALRFQYWPLVPLTCNTSPPINTTSQIINPTFNYQRSNPFVLFVPKNHAGIPETYYYVYTTWWDAHSKEPKKSTDEHYLDNQILYCVHV